MSTKTQNKKLITEGSVESKPRNRYIEPTTLKNEASDFAKAAVHNAWDSILGGAGSSLSEQLFGFGSENELPEGQAVTLSRTKIQEKAEKVQVTAEHMEYFRTVNNAERAGESRTETEISAAVDQIRMEIKRLIQTSKIVERTVKDATSEQAPVRPGKYHITFFEFVLGVLKDATRKLEDTVSYGAVFTSKKQQSKYWSSYKKQGTTFGLSGERTVATQTG